MGPQSIFLHEPFHAPSARWVRPVVQEPGDVLFVPEGWGHATILGSYAALGQRKMGERMDDKLGHF